MKWHKMKIFLVGGGTGGHAAPLLAVYEQLKVKKADFEYYSVGIGSSEEKEFFSHIPNYQVIRSGKFHRYLTWRNLLELIKLKIGFLQSIVLIFKYHPDIVFSKGGYASLPFIYAAKICSIPYFIHESDIAMGRVNFLLAKGAKKVFTTYEPKYYPKINKNKLIFSGPLLRRGYEKEGKADKSSFGFDNPDPVILVTGGSQGSLNIWKGFEEIGAGLLNSYNIIYSAGKHSLNAAEKFKNSLPPNLNKKFYLTPFLTYEGGKDLMLEAANLSDLVITRAGSTITELAILGKAMILIPWKHAAQNHQVKNAEFFKERKAAEVISDDDLTGERLIEKINDLFAYNGVKLKKLRDKIKGILPNNGAKLAADEIEKEVL